MAYPEYRAKTASLVNHLEQQGQLVLFDEPQTPAKFLIKTCNISPRSGYMAIDHEESQDLSMDTLWKIYRGLRGLGLTVQDGSAERLIEFSDIVEIIHN